MVIKYEIYKNSRDASWKFLIEHKVKSLPVDLKTIVHEMGIAVKEDVSGILDCTEKGKVITGKEKKFIIIKNSDIYQNRYTIMHEIGHIVFGHDDKPYEEKSDEYKVERFAIDVLAPACVIWGLDIHTAEDIQKLCQISLTSAKIRAERIEMLYKKDMFLSNQLERKVFIQFKDFIKNYKY